MKKVFLFFATLLALFSCDEGNKAKDKAFKTTMSEKGQLSVLLSKPVNDENYSDFNRSPNGLKTMWLKSGWIISSMIRCCFLRARFQRGLICLLSLLSLRVIFMRGFP